MNDHCIYWQGLGRLTYVIVKQNVLVAAGKEVIRLHKLESTISDMRLITVQKPDPYDHSLKK